MIWCLIINTIFTPWPHTETIPSYCDLCSSCHHFYLSLAAKVRSWNECIPKNCAINLASNQPHFFVKNNHTLTKMYENWILWKKARFLVHSISDLTLDLLSSWLFWIPGGIAQQASVYHGQAYDLPRQLIRKRLHQEKE